MTPAASPWLRALRPVCLVPVLLATLAGCGEDGAGALPPPSPSTSTPGSSPSGTRPTVAPPSPGPVSPQEAADSGGLRLPDSATGASAEQTTTAEGLPANLLVFTLPGTAELERFCVSEGMNGPFPEPDGPSEREVQDLGISPDAEEVARCYGSLPGDYAVQRNVVASSSAAGLEVRVQVVRTPS